MRAVLVYESMFGSTKVVATAIADGMIGAGMQVDVVRAADGYSSLLAGTDAIVVGCPTHARGMPRPSTRRGAPEYVAREGSGLMLEPGADTATGVREWLAAHERLVLRAVAFDTRSRGPALFTGRAAKSVDRALEHRGAIMIARPESFLTRQHHLIAGEADRARLWGEWLAGQLDAGSAH